MSMDTIHPRPWKVVRNGKSVVVKDASGTTLSLADVLRELDLVVDEINANRIPRAELDALRAENAQLRRVVEAAKAIGEEHCAGCPTPSCPGEECEWWALAEILDGHIVTQCKDCGIYGDTPCKFCAALAEAEKSTITVTGPIACEPGPSPVGPDTVDPLTELPPPEEKP